MITINDLHIQFRNETGFGVDKDTVGYYKWIENLYLDKLNEEMKLNEKITNFMLQDGE